MGGPGVGSSGESGAHCEGGKGSDWREEAIEVGGWDAVAGVVVSIAEICGRVDGGTILRVPRGFLEDGFRDWFGPVVDKGFTGWMKGGCRQKGTESALSMASCNPIEVFSFGVSGVSGGG